MIKKFIRHVSHFFKTIAEALLATKFFLDIEYYLPTHVYEQISRWKIVEMGSLMREERIKITPTSNVSICLITPNYHRTNFLIIIFTSAQFLH